MFSMNRIVLSLRKLPGSFPGQAPLTAWLLAFAIILCPGLLSAQASHTTQLPGLDVTMKLDRTSIVVGEPLALNIQLENTSQLPTLEVRANFHLPPGNSVEINVQPPGELEYRYMGALDMGTYFSVPINIMAGKPESMSLLLLFDRSQASGLLFPRPGTYTVSGRFKVNIQKSPTQAEAVLPPVQITVTEPTGKEAGVLEVLNSPEYIHAVHLGVAPTTNSLIAVSEAGKKFPDTRLGALALKAEGLQYTRGESNEDRSRGAALLKNYLQNGPVYGDGDQVALEIAAAYHRNRKYDVAREWIFWLVRNCPQSARIQEADALMYYYYFQPAAFARDNPWYLLKESWVVPGEVPPADLRPRQGDEK